MKKRSLPFYMLLIASAFLLFWLLFVVLMLQAVDTMVQSNLQEQIELTRTQIARHIAYRAKDLIASYASVEPVPLGSVEDLVLYLDDMEQLYPGCRFYAVDAAGVICDGAGYVGSGLDMAQLQALQLDGFLASEFSAPDGEAMYVFTVRVADTPDFYLMQFQTIEDFAHDLTNNLAIELECSAVFDEWGNQIVHIGPTTMPDHDAISKAIRQGAMEFRIEPSAHIIQRTGWGLSYNIYIPLTQPRGWIWGAHLPTGLILPAFSEIFMACFIPFVSWVVMVLIFVAVALASRSNKRRELQLANHRDFLTGLLNGPGMEDSVGRFVSKITPGSYCMVCLDIIAFHRFNNIYGYISGDILLRTIADAIREHYDCGARMANDNFAFLCELRPNMTDEILDTLRSAVDQAFGAEYRETVQFKIGINTLHRTNQSARELYDNALIALRDAKKTPQRSYSFFSDALAEEAELQKRIERHMQQAIKQDEFQVYIQPKFDVQTGSCEGGEALIRWSSKELGQLSPNQFIPVFESNGFIVDLDFYMLSRTLDFLQNLYEEGLTLIPIAINQSRITITSPAYIDRLKALIMHYTLPLEFVEIEVTESVAANDYEQITTLVEAYKKLGFSVAMDDFGAGYSSLNTLRILPVDVLKIDKEFLKESDVSERSRTIIKNIVNMSREIGIKVVCEGVETHQQFEFLREISCDFVQGYLFSYPIPSHEFESDYIRSVASVFGTVIVPLVTQASS